MRNYHRACVFMCVTGGAHTHAKTRWLRGIKKRKGDGQESKVFP